MKIQYYGNRKHCIGISDGHVENLITIESATELHEKLGKVLAAAVREKPCIECDEVGKHLFGCKIPKLD